MRILFIGDIVGRPGRELVKRGVPGLVDLHQIDLVVANVENAAAGFGITREIGDQILACGVDVMTSGNHIWDKREAIDYIGAEPRLLRPANYPAGVPGNGSYVARTADGRTAAIINVMGRVFMLPIDDPFAVVRKEIEAVRRRARVVLVDFHAEATSEKIAMGWHLDGHATAVIGTHTHVQTADDRVLPKGTAYLTDVGMTGPHDSIIGVEVEAAMSRFLTGMPARFEVASGNPQLNAVVIEADEQTGNAVGIERLNYTLDELLPTWRKHLMSDLFDLPFEEEEEPPQAPPVTRPVPVPPAVRQVLSVTELTVRIRDRLEAEFYEVWVEGELSNCRVWNTGHLYFTLKDSSTQVRGIIFRTALRYLKFKPTDGLRVVARGRVSVYEPKGEYQLVCEHLEPHGLGALQLAFEQLKKRLSEEGLFDTARKRPLPTLPRKIGIVTSLDGAALRDVIKVLERRHANVRLVIRPTRVQGEGAALEVARGLRAIARVPQVDVVIVGRGGGSIEDLWAFNEEVVARAIAACPVPVVSAVGHETDVTIADFVADLRAPTPSAAAEMVVSAKDEFRARIDRLHGRLTSVVRARVQSLSRRVHVLAARPALAALPARVAMRSRHAADLSHDLLRVARARVAARERRLTQLRRQLDGFDVGRRLGTLRARLVAARGRLGGAMMLRQHRAKRQLGEGVGRLEALSPLAVLGRGYAVCWTADRARIVREAGAVERGDRVRVTLARGELDECEVRDKTS